MKSSILEKIQSARDRHLSDLHTSDFELCLNPECVGAAEAELREWAEWMECVYQLPRGSVVIEDKELT
jgi:hypothetical protein